MRSPSITILEICSHTTMSRRCGYGEDFMPFDLVIAVKRDPGEGPELKPVTARAKTAVLEANGALTHDGAAALAKAVDEAVSPEFRDYIVRLGTITEVDNDALLIFVQWVRGRRDEGIDIRLCALEPHIYYRLESLREVADALMPLDQAANDTARRIVDVRQSPPDAPTDEPL
jgi:ABC-type transporter Mla MlaB component